MLDDYRETVFFGIAGSCPYEYTAVGTAYTRPVQAQARPNPSMEREAGYEIPSQDEELLGIVSCWEQSQFFSKSVLLVKPHTQEYLHSTNWPWIFFKGHKVEQIGKVGVDLERGAEGEGI